MADVWANLMACHPTATCHIVIVEPHVTLQGKPAARGEFNVMIPEPQAILQGVEEIHSVGAINNVETSYFTQTENVLPNDNVSMSFGHLDHVLIVYSWMEHVTWKSPGSMCG